MGAGGKRRRTLGGQGGEHIDVEWLGYERSAPPTNRAGVRWGQVFAGASAGALAALAALALLGLGTSEEPAAATTATTVTTSTLQPPLDGLSDDAGCVAVGEVPVC